MHKSEGVSEEIYRQLKQELINLELKPGRSISENEVSERFSSSRTPTRDVFTRLEMDGLLIVKPHVGTVVSKINLDFVRDVLYMREKLELAVLEELAKTIDPMQKFKLSLLLMEQGELLKKELSEQQLAEQFHVSDNKFHRTMFQLVKREHVFDHIVNSFYDYERFRVFLNFTQKKNLEALYSEHLELIDNLSVNNVSRMSDILHEHLYNGLNKSLSHIDEHPQYFINKLEIK